MEIPKENRQFYKFPSQRELLLALLTHPSLNESFFLTGGTALAVFYLHHRISDDLDFFSRHTLDFSEIDLWIRSKWKSSCAKIKEGSQFLSFLIQETKVEFVIDPLSNSEPRSRIEIEQQRFLLIDNIKNILTNKLNALVSRMEPKDFVDFYFLTKQYSDYTIDELYDEARKKDAIFDDPPTAAFQLEEGLHLIAENPSLLPDVKKDFDFAAFTEYYKNVAHWLYKKVNILKN
jgi:predicted nucleotidyltransferase component of viral defense system